MTLEPVIEMLSKLRAEGVQAGDERAKFETDYLERHGPLACFVLHDDGDYWDPKTRACWASWRSRAALASAPVADTLPLEKALYELVDKIAPGLDTGDLVQDARRASTLLGAIMASAPVAGEAQHPDDIAVDNFAAAMKAKLAKKRAEGRYGWQSTSHITLSALLYEHMYKGDPLDVGNLAMMLHQNGKPIELPEHARRKDAAPQASEAVRTHNDAIEAAAKVCIEIARQYDPQNSQENALASELYAAARIIRKQAKEDSAALAAQPSGNSGELAAQEQGDSDE
jgi:hypothetical protein